MLVQGRAESVLEHSTCRISAGAQDARKGVTAFARELSWARSGVLGVGRSCAIRRVRTMPLVEVHLEALEPGQ
jgi:hypothetical protein